MRVLCAETNVRSTIAFVCLLSLAGLVTTAHAGTVGPALSKKDLDPAATLEWVDGVASGGIVFHPNQDHPSWVVSVKNATVGHSGVRFGVSKNKGVRHLRLGFTRPVAVGSVLAAGPGTLSVLRADVDGFGDLGDDKQWTAAERLGSGEVSLWVLAPQTVTRALRYSVTSDDPNAAEHAGRLGGLCVFEDRWRNLAPYATIVARAEQAKTHRIVNHRLESWWDPWDNGNDGGGRVVSPEHPEWAMLTWPKAATLRGLCLLWAGFSRVKVEAYTGGDNVHPREAPADAWRDLGEHNVQHGYPSRLPATWLDFGEEVTTRAIRLTMTAPIDEKRSHGHVHGKSRDGKRVWLGEALALSDLGTAPPATPSFAAEEALHPPVPIRFTLEKPGYVTLVIDDAQGRRVRNIISATWFEAGEHTVWWDGLDETPVNMRAHRIYDIQGRLVDPGTCTVRGLVHDGLTLHYEFSVYSPGYPPWSTAGGTGGWLADHSPPSDVLYVPGREQVLIAAHVAETGDGLIGVDLEGRRRWGQRWIGGHWTGATHLVCDRGIKAIEGVYAIAASHWNVDTDANRGEVRICGLTDDGRYRDVFRYRTDSRDKARLGGVAVYDGLIVVGLPALGKLLFVDGHAGKELGAVEMLDVRDVAFDEKGRLLVLAGDALRRHAVATEPGVILSETETPAEKLDQPQRLALGPDGRIYVSLGGKAHNVQVLGPDGAPRHTIGTPGGPQLGRYDETRMHNPRGLTVTPDGRLWVAESDLAPKRVSVWQLDGTFVRAFYGPPQYGGGGTIDPRDPSRFYYARDGGHVAMEFRLDWETGASRLHSVYYRPADDGLTLGGRQSGVGPQTPIYLNGRQYMTNVFNMNPTGGADVAGLWILRDDVAVPVAAIGRASSWKALRADAIQARLPDGMKLDAGTFFAWSDLDGDQAVQPEEVSFARVPGGTVILMPDLAAVTSYGALFRPARFAASGAPVYDLGAFERLLPEDVVIHWTSGGGECLPLPGGWAVLTGGPMRGFRDGKLVWTCPSQWSSLHGGHSAPVARHPGEMVATTRLIGYGLTPPEGEAGPFWAQNGDTGNVYLLTADGLFLSELGRDGRVGRRWAMPKAERGMRVDNVSFIGEHFWPGVHQTEGGSIYLVVGKSHSSIARLEGLKTVRRLPVTTFELTPEDRAACAAYQARLGRARVQKLGRDTLTVFTPRAAPTVDGDLAEWADASFVNVGAYNAYLEQVEVKAAVARSAGRLYAAIRTGDKDLLNNTGESMHLLFKTGGALDLMLATKPDAPADRTEPAAGDVRLLVTRVKGETRAVLYRPVDPTAPEENAVAFSSPWRSVRMDHVLDVSDKVELAGAEGRFELSVPLDVLGLAAKPGLETRGDIGILRGSEGATIQRLYWHNKATNITSDVPSEAALTPHLWGRWRWR